MTVISLGEVWAQFQESALTEVTHAHVKRLSWVSRELLLVQIYNKKMSVNISLLAYFVLFKSIIIF